MRYSKIIINILGAMAVGVAVSAGAVVLGAQTPATDAGSRLRQVLPADVATRVLAVLARARSHELPTEPLENRALKFAARGVRPDSIERSVVDHETRMERAKDVLTKARGRRPADDEIEAGADALRKGVSGPGVEELARSAPSGRSFGVPVFVVGGLLDRGMPSDDALKRVSERLNARVSDGDLEKLPTELPAQAAWGQSHKPAETGRAIAETKGRGVGQGNGSAGPPAGVPGNGGAKAKPNPGRGSKPTTPPGKKP
jgi:hypothetical protein